MMADYMVTFGSRIGRARQQITNFDRISRNYFEPPPYEVILERESRISNDWIDVSVKITKQFPASLGFNFAECIHNLRSVV